MYGEIGREISAAKLAAALQASDAGTVLVHINSDGGDLVEGNVIYNMLVKHAARIEVEIDGIAASSASLIAMAGDEIRIAENAMLMIHEPWGAQEGTADDHEEIAGILRKCTSAMADTYARRTGKDVAAVAKMMSDETWMTAAEAVAQGFADKLIESRKIAARIRNSKRFKRMPKRLASDGSSWNEKMHAIDSALRSALATTDYSCGSPWVCDVFDASVVYEYDGKLYEAPYSMAGSTVTLGQAAEVKRSYSPIAAPAIAAKRRKPKGASTMDPKQITEALDALIAGDTAKCAEILKGIIATAAGGAAPADGSPPGDDVPMALEPEEEEKMLAALGTLAASAKLMVAARELTGETKPDSVLAALMALKAGAGEGTKLATRLATLESEATAREVEGLIAANTKKIGPTLDAWARTQSPDALRAFLKHAPEVTRTPASPDAKPSPDLSPTALALCAKKKVDPKKVQELRAQMRRGQE